MSWRRWDPGPLRGTTPGYTDSSIVDHLETSEEGHVSVGSLLAPEVPLKETGIPVVEWFFGCEQGGSLLRILGV